MTYVNIDEITKDIQGFLLLIESGETVIITKAGKPFAEIKAIAPKLKNPSPFGLCAGEFLVPDDFDAPLPESVIRDFEG